MHCLEVIIALNQARVDERQAEREALFTWIEEELNEYPPQEQTEAPYPS